MHRPSVRPSRGFGDRKISFSDAPVLMGNFNGTMLAQKMAKKAKHWTFNHYLTNSLSLIQCLLFGGKVMEVD